MTHTHTQRKKDEAESILLQKAITKNTKWLFHQKKTTQLKIKDESRIIADQMHHMKLPPHLKQNKWKIRM